MISSLWEFSKALNSVFTGLDGSLGVMTDQIHQKITDQPIKTVTFISDFVFIHACLYIKLSSAVSNFSLLPYITAQA